MENDSKPRMYSHVGEKLLSETSVDSNCQKKLILYQEIKLKYLHLTSLSLKTVVSVKIQNLLVIQVNNNMICFPCYCLLVYL